MKPVLYDRKMNRVRTIFDASSIGYKTQKNDLYTAQFSLPEASTENDVCQNVHYIVDVFDGDRSVGKYRLGDEPEAVITEEGSFLQYTCEHVLAFLFDDRIDGYLEMGGTDVKTREVIEALLNLQTPVNGVKRWQLGRCDFDYQFQHSFENTDILNAIFSIPRCFSDDYHWEFDTESYPWTLNLVRGSVSLGCAIRYNMNSVEIRRSKDVSNLVTRLYCLGSGEGVNQTNIKSVNDGKNYIDSPNIEKYGVISKHLIDTSISDPEILFSKGKAYIAQLDEPLYSYSVKAIDFYRMTGIEFNRIAEGKQVIVEDEVARTKYRSVILSVEKRDVEGDPLDMDIVIANKSEDIASTIESISARTAITAQYSQGSTNLFPLQVMDNADADHPLTLSFYLPEDVKKINRCIIKWKLERFRTHVKAAASGGGSSQTSSDGGKQAITLSKYSNTATFFTGTPLNIADNAPQASTGHPNDKETDSSGSDQAETSGVRINGKAASKTGEDGKHKHTMYQHYHGTVSHQHSVGATVTGGASPVTTDTTSKMYEDGSHTHSFGHVHNIDLSHTHTHDHTHGMVHKHEFNLQVEIPSQQIDIPDHTHSVSIPEHSHEMTFGIYEGTTAETITIKVDDTVIPIEEMGEDDELDIVKYMRADDAGKILRRSWHTVEFAPDKLTRIEANLFMQTFITSYAGGEY